jgi:antimicrobial peptide system SdpB family protein
VPHCAGVGRASLFCVVPPSGVSAVRWIAVAVLVIVASGWRPRLTCVPHWWIAFSVGSSIAVEDGGDQITVVLALLLVPIALGDPRTWVWRARPEHEPERRRRGEDVWRLVALSALVAVRVQVAMLYFQSSTAKLGVPGWQNGTAVYYFLNNSVVGAPGWLRLIVEPFLRNGFCVEAITCGSLVVEFALFLALLLPPRFRGLLLAAGFLLHLSIAIAMGLPSFALAMWGALVLYLCPPDRGPSSLLPPPLRYRLLLRPWLRGPAWPASVRSKREVRVQDSGESRSEQIELTR